MRYKVGDKVFIKSSEEIIRNRSYDNKYIYYSLDMDYGWLFDREDMGKFCGCLVEIYSINKGEVPYYEILVEENGERVVDYNQWEDWMFDDRRDKVIICLGKVIE